MKKEWKKAFDPIRADEEVKEKTRERAAEMRDAVQGNRGKRRRPVWQAAAVAVLALALVAGGFGHYTITAEAAYVSMEAEGVSAEETTEPGLGLSVNRWGNVIRAEGLNETGKIVLSQVDPIGKSYEEALEEILEKAAELGYLEEETHVDFSVCAGSDSALVQSLQAESQNVVDTVCPYVYSGCGWVSSQTRSAASATGMSCNRYQVAEDIMALDSRVTLEDCNGYTLRQLKCWYQALSDGRTVEPEDVPQICAEYGYGCGGNGCGYGNYPGSGNGQNNGTGSNGAAEQNPSGGAGQNNGAGPGYGNGSGNGNGAGSGYGNGYGSGAGQRYGNGSGNCRR